MTSNVPLASAKIYQFPVRGRMVVGGRHEETKPAVRFGAPRVAAAFGNCWYHEAAILESEQLQR